MTKDSHFERRKLKKDKIENLYKILGTRSNIGQGRIKEKYIEKLREFPPETHPEEFEEIRRAYETLKDIDKRKQYDMLRKYGDKLEKIMDDIMFSMSIGELEKAQKLIDHVLEIEPDNNAVKLTKAELLLNMEEVEEFCDFINNIIEMCHGAEKQDVIFIKFIMLYAKGYYDRAIAELTKGLVHIIDMKQFHEYRVMAFLGLGDFQQAWYEFKSALPSIDNLNIDDLELLLLWLNTGIELEKWGELSKINNCFRKLSKTIVDEEELSILKYHLIKEVELYVDVNRYREAEIFIKLASQIYPKDISIQKRRKVIQSIAKLDIELKRAYKDNDLIPYVHVKVLELFLAKYSDSESYEEFINDYPHEMMREMEWMKEDIAYGVLRIKKKYPSLYKEFNKELTELFNESTKGLNREQRRSLR